jgi:hypothetical protein
MTGNQIADYGRFPVTQFYPIPFSQIGNVNPEKSFENCSGTDYTIDTARLNHSSAYHL